MVIIFDLDDTLYDESAFVFSGFVAVANYLSKITGKNSQSLYLRMKYLLNINGRGKVFDILLDENFLKTKKNIKKCLSIYRGHRPKIKLYPGVLRLIKNLSNNSLYLVTDGNKLVQMSKIKSLGITSLFKKLFLTGYYGHKAHKPSVYCFEKIKKLEKCDWSDMIYIADDPNKDFVNLNKLGVTTVRVGSGRYATQKAKKGYDAKYRIEKVSKFSINSFLENN